MRRYLEEVVGDGKLELIPELAAEDMEDHSSDIPGRAGLEAHVTRFRQCIPDVEMTVLRVIASFDDVVGVWRWRGTHSAELFGVPATGRALDVTIASIFKMRQGKSSTTWSWRGRYRRCNKWACPSPCDESDHCMARTKLATGPSRR